MLDFGGGGIFVGFSVLNRYYSATDKDREVKMLALTPQVEITKWQKGIVGAWVSQKETYSQNEKLKDSVGIEAELVMNK